MSVFNYIKSELPSDAEIINAIVNDYSYNQYKCKISNPIKDDDYTLLKKISDWEFKRFDKLKNKNEKFTEGIASMPNLLYIRDPKTYGLNADEGTSEDGDVYTAYGHIDSAIDKGCDAEIAIYELNDIVTVKNETKIVEE